jgi:hypothetical protein
MLDFVERDDVDETIAVARGGTTTFLQPRLPGYVRETHDTPISDLRRLGEAEMADLLAKAEQASSRLYARIARMSYREKIMAGVLVYYIDWVAAMARPLGLWDRFVTDYDAYAIDPLTLSYEPLVEPKQAEVIVPPLFITGSGFQPLGP